jgi:hypothetical protein
MPRSAGACVWIRIIMYFSRFVSVLFLFVARSNFSFWLLRRFVLCILILSVFCLRIFRLTWWFVSAPTSDVSIISPYPPPARRSWSTPSRNKTVVPSTALYFTNQFAGSPYAITIWPNVIVPATTTVITTPLPYFIAGVQTSITIQVCGEYVHASTLSNCSRFWSLFSLSLSSMFAIFLFLFRTRRQPHITHFCIIIS